MLASNRPQNRVPLPFAPKNTPVVSGYLTDMDAPLVQFDDEHAFTLRNAFEGVQVFGGIGAGKTSGSGQTLAHAYLKAGFGGLVLCAKIDEAESWKRYAEACGRDHALIRFSDVTGGRFNFLDYALHTGKTTQDAVDVLMNVVKIANGDGVEASGKDTFWQDSAEQILSHAIDLLYCAFGTVKLSQVSQLIEDAPKSGQEVLDKGNNPDDFYNHVITRVALRPARPMAREDILAIQQYFRGWTTRHDKFQSSVIATLTTALRHFEKGALREMFTTTSNIVPEMTHAGAVIVVDLSEHQWGKAGLIAQHIIKYAWQRAAMRRPPNDDNRPIFLWCDESQYFITSYDATFQSTARSYRAATVYLTQSVNAYKDAIGGTNAHDTVMSLLGNLRTHIFHQTASPDTQKYAAEMVGKGLLWRENIGDSHTIGEGVSDSTSENIGASTSDSGGNYLFGLAKGMQTGWSNGDTYGTSTTRGTNTSTSQSVNRGASQQKDYLIEPSYFRTALRTGGEPHDFVVDGVVVAPNLPPYLHVHFPQRLC